MWNGMRRRSLCKRKAQSGREAVEYVVPDVLVERRGGELIVTTNTTVMPRLHINHSYVRLLREKADEQTEEYITEQLNIHEPTVSRAVKEKYLQCERGVFPLPAFFSKAIVQAEENVSADNIKNRLRAVIDAEEKSKPLSDRELTEKLAAEGIRICRRTVTNYREAMDIAGASGRKRYDMEK